MNNAPSANKNNPIGTTPADAWSAARDMRVSMSN